jgi:hypothetical protein
VSAQRYLEIYLNDHLAGSTTGRALARRVAKHGRSAEFRAPLERIAAEIEQDREALIDIMRRCGAERNPVKIAGGMLVERLGRLKRNGQLVRPSPLTPLVELEALSVGVEGKLELWRALGTVSRDDELSERLDELIERGESQRAELERLRLAAAQNAFGNIVRRNPGKARGTRTPASIDNEGGSP